MARCWLRMAVLGVTLALTSGLPFSNHDSVVLLGEPANSASGEAKDDRFYGQIHQDGVERLERTHRGTPKAGKITEPLMFEESKKKVVKKVAKKDEKGNFRVLNAVINAASQLQQKGEIPAHIKDHELEERVDKANKELIDADVEHEKRLSTKAQNKEYEAITAPIANLTYSDAPMSNSDVKKRKDKAAESKTSKTMDATKIVRNMTKLQYRYDIKPITQTEDSPSYEQAAEMEQQDSVMEQQVNNEAQQYNALKKTGILKPLAAIKTAVKKSKLDQAKELIASVAEQNGEQKVFDQQDQHYEGKYSDSARTDFSEDKHESAVTSPQAQALYEKYKAKEEAGVDFAADVAAVKAAKAAGEVEHNEMLYKAKLDSPTKESVAKLLKEGDAGAVALQKDVDLQAELDAQNAKHPNRLPKTIEEEMKRRKLLEVTRWQAQTLLEEGKEAITNQAYQLEESGSAADLALVEANVKRIKEGRPALSAGEVNTTLTIMASDRKLAKEVGPEIMKVFQKNMNASNQKIADSVQELEVGATADSDLEPGMSYAGDSDELLPDSINDPMLAKDGTYGDAYDPNDFNLDDPDDEIDTRAVDDETALDTDSDEEAQVSKEAAEEDRIDQPEETLHQDATAQPGTKTYDEKVSSGGRIAPDMPDAMAPDAPDPNMPVLNDKAGEGGDPAVSLKPRPRPNPVVSQEY